MRQHFFGSGAWNGFLFAADGAGSIGGGAPTSDGGASGQGSAPAAPVASPPPASAPVSATGTGGSPAPSSPSPTSSGATQGGSTGGAPAATPEPGGFRSIRDVSRELGWDFGQGVTDDHAALLSLINQAQQNRQLQQQLQSMQQLAQHGQTYLQHAPQFNEWLAKQQAAAQAAEAEKKNWFKAPEWDPRWQNFLTKDAQGNVVATQGAPPGIVDKYLAWTNHQRNFMEKLAQDPMGALRPGIEQVAQEMAEKIVQQRLGGYQGQTYAENFVNQHSSWLHLRDGTGNIVPDQNGQLQLSPAGQRFQQHVADAQRMGIQNGKDRAEYAYRMLTAEVNMQRAAPAAAAAQNGAAGDAQKAAFLANAAANRPNAGGVAVPPTNPNQQTPLPNGTKTSKRDLEAALMRAMEAAGLKSGQPVDLAVR